MKRPAWVVGSLVLLLGFGGIAAWRTQQALERQASAEQAMAVGPLPVEVQVAARHTLTEVAMLAGTLRPINELDVVADVPGRVMSLRVEIGDRVGAGDTLATLEREDADAAADQARAAVAAARAALEAATTDRDAAEKLLASQNMSEVQAAGARSRHAASKAQLDQALAGLRLAEARLSDTTIRAPIAGVITDRQTGPGRMVNPGAPLFHLQDTSSLELELYVDEEVAPRLAAGSTVQVVAGEQVVQGTVRVASPTLDPRTRRMKVLVSVPSEGLVPYVTAAARLVLQQKEAVAVPSRAVVLGADSARVVVARDGRAVHVPVQAGVRDGELVEVSGLGEGEQVVIDGAAALVDGREIEPHVVTAAAP